MLKFNNFRKMTPAFLALLCVWNPEWSEEDIRIIETEAGKEFIPEISVEIVAKNSSNGFSDKCTMRVRVRGKVEKCSDLVNKTHKSYCRDFLMESASSPKYRIYIETVSACALNWEAEISTPANNDPVTLGGLLQHTLVTHLGLRTDDYVNLLAKMSNQDYSHCEHLHGVKTKMGEMIKFYNLKSLGCGHEFRIWLVFTTIVRASVGLLSMFLLPLGIFCIIYNGLIYERLIRDGHNPDRYPVDDRLLPEAQEQARGAMAGALLVPAAGILSIAVMASLGG